ncbi:hypothetical protein E4U42_003518 [Claviceps africana]|uniref:Uncharacterized protein n=1 Tax=Claviceps africana TaxID=83212 RepID=A0A8K0J6Q3_9HYPO|nr:hypothetical protein E4U42_003518 [Claviceps africana]
MASSIIRHVVPQTTPDSHSPPASHRYSFAHLPTVPALARSVLGIVAEQMDNESTNSLAVEIVYASSTPTIYCGHPANLRPKQLIRRTSKHSPTHPWAWEVAVANKGREWS